jgi:hypothetical protein
MNPEIRFRVPAHVHKLANNRAQALGLRTRRGRTGGASELARCALYTFLGLGLPDESGKLTGEGIQRVEATRDEIQGPDPEGLRVTVHHRVCPEFRKKRGLGGRAVAARQTTDFHFQPGELPDFLVPYVLLTESGTPFVTLNLEGALSPRKNSLGELLASSDRATLEELGNCLQAVARRKKERQAERALSEERREKGTELLKAWTQSHGSDLLQARLVGQFEWLELACLEYALHQLKKLGLSQLTHLPTTHTLEGSSHRFRNTRPQAKPQLSTLRVFDKLKELQDEGLEFSVVLVEDTRTHTIQEAIQVSLTVPVPGRMHFLTALNAADPT